MSAAVQIYLPCLPASPPASPAARRAPPRAALPPSRHRAGPHAQASASPKRVAAVAVSFQLLVLEERPDRFRRVEVVALLADQEIEYWPGRPLAMGNAVPAAFDAIEQHWRAGRA